MAESILLFFREAPWPAVWDWTARWADGAVTDEYLLHPRSDHLLTFYEHRDLLGEAEPDELIELRRRLGGLPSAALCVELRRSKSREAIEAATDFALLALERFEGVADNGYDQLFALSDLRRPGGSEAFLDWYRARLVNPST